MFGYCPNCGLDTITHIEIRNETYPVKGCPIEIDAEVRVCNSCGEALSDIGLDDRAFVQAFNKYRTMKNLLMPEEIKAIRENCGVSESLFEKVLGLPEKRIMWYEKGSLQDEVQNNLILLMKDKFNFLWLATRANLTDAERACVRSYFG